MRKTLRQSGFLAMVMMIVGMFFVSDACAQVTKTWVPSNGGNWAIAGNWSPSGVPTSTDHVLIPSNQTGTITRSGTTNEQIISIRGLTISGNVNFAFDPGLANFCTLNITETFIVDATKTLTIGIANTGRMNLTLASSAIGTLNGTVNINTTTTNGFERSFNNNGDLTISSTGLVNGQTDAIFALGSAGTLRIANSAGITITGATGAIQNPGPRTFPSSANYVYNGTVNQNTGNGYPSALTGSISIDNPGNIVTITNASRTITTGTLNLLNGTFATDNGGNRLSLGSTAQVNRSSGIMTGTLQGGGTYNVTYTGTSKTTGTELSGTGLNNVTISLLSGQTLTLDGNRTPDGSLSVTSGTFDLSTFTINRSNSGGALNVSNGAFLRIGGTNPAPTNYSTRTFAPSSTVDYYGDAQNISTETFGHLNISAGVKTTTGTVGVAGDLFINSGVIVNTTNSWSITGNWTVFGSFNQTAASTTFTGGGTHMFSFDGISQFNDLITSGQTINASSHDIRIAGNWVHGTAGIVNTETSTITFNGSSNQTQATTSFIPNFHNLTINKPGGTLSSRVWTVNNVLRMPNGNFSPETGSTFNEVVLSGGTLNTPAAGAITASGTLTLNANSTINLGAGAHTLSFGSSSAATWAGGAMLTVNGWTGAYDGTSGTGGKLYIGTDVTGLTPGQLAQIQFFNGTTNFSALQLSDGEVVPQATDPVLSISGTADHGSICIGSSATTITYTITNFGLQADGIEVNSSGPQFVVSNLTGTSIPMNGSVSFDVIFTAGGSGPQSAIISVTSTTVGSNSPSINLTGTGVAPPFASINPVGSQVVCANESYTVQSTEVTVANGSVLWTHNGTGTITNPTSTSPTYNAALLDGGNQVILTLTVTNIPCTDATATYTININPVPAIFNVTGSTSICSGTGINISLDGSVVGVSYQLRNNAGNEPIGIPVAGTGGTINLPTGALTSPTTFNVLATDDVTLCAIQMSGTATVTILPLPVANFNASSLSVTTGAVVNFTNTSTNANTYAWQFTGGNPLNSSNTNESVTYNTAGSFLVTLTASNSTCPSVTDVETASVNVTSLGLPLQFDNPAGANSFVVPPGVMCIRVEAIGAGAGGGSGTGDRKGGGGGGAYTKGSVSVSPGGTVNITVGNAGGVGQNGGSSGVGGVVANGGLSTTNQNGGNGGAASSLTGGVIVSNSGGSGGAGQDNGGGGGGGASATATGAGANGDTGGGSTGGNGGGTGAGSGGDGGDEDGSPSADPGNAPGGGGGGRGDDAGTSAAGANGQVIVSWIDVSNFNTSTVAEICQNIPAVVTVSSSTLANGTYAVDYSVGGANTGTGSATVTMSGGTGTFSIPAGAGQLLQNPGTTTVTITAIKFTDGLCSQMPPNNTSVFVIENTTIDWVNTSGSVSQTICSTVTPTSIVSIVYQLGSNATGATLSWAPGTPAGVTTDITGSYNSGNNQYTVSGATNIIGAHVYTVTPIRPVSPECVNTVSGTINVITVPAQPSNFTASQATVCPNSTGVVYTVPAVAGATSYTWSVPADWTITNDLGNSITVTTGLLGGDVSVIPNNICGPGTARTIAVTISAANDVGFNGNINTNTLMICQGTATTIVSGADAPGGGQTYEWQVSTTAPGTTGYTTASNTTNNDQNYDVDNDYYNVPGVYYFRRIITNNATCNSISDVVVLTVSPPAPGAVGAISGQALFCEGVPSLTYTVDPVANATEYLWTVPTGWTITSNAPYGNSINVTPGSAGQNGNITVIATNFCGSNNPSTSVTLAPVSGTNNTGYVTGGGTKNSDQINVTQPTTGTQNRGYVKFPLNVIPPGVDVISATLTLRQTPTSAQGNTENIVSALGNNDPVTTAGSTLYTAIGTGAQYSLTQWTGTGNIVLSLNATAVNDIESRISSPSYIAFGLARQSQATSNMYQFFGYSAGANAPSLAVTYTSPRSLAVTVAANPVALVTGPTAICEGTTTQLSPITGGSWVSSHPSIASVTNAGLVTGIGEGSATFTFTFDAAPGCFATTEPVSVAAAQTISVSSDIDPPVICQGSATGIELNTQTGGTGVFPLTWDADQDGTFTYPFSPFFDNEVERRIAIFVPAANVSGPVAITATTSDPAGACVPVTSEPFIITVNPAATAEAGPDLTICSNATATLPATPYGGGATGGSWAVSGGDGEVVGNIYIPGINDKAAVSQFVVTLTYTTDDPDGAGPCVAVSDFMLLTINPSPAVPTISGGPAGAVCPGTPFTFSGPAGANSYTWSVTGNFASPGANNGETFTVNAGPLNASFTVSLVVTNENCSETNQLLVNVLDDLPPVITAGTIVNCYTTVEAAEADALAATSAVDNCSSGSGPGEELTYVASTEFGAGCVATVKVTVTDASGNSDFVTYITRVDGVAPTIGTVTTPNTCFQDINDAKAALEAATLAASTDNCPGELFASSVVSGDPCNTSITVTIADGCGNSSSLVFNDLKIFTVNPAEVGSAETETEIECITGDLASQVILPVVSDQCGTILSPAGAPVQGGTFDGCDGTITYTYTYNDCSGRSFDWTFTYNVVRVNPVLEDGAADIEATVECVADAIVSNIALPVILDACENVLQPLDPNPAPASPLPGCEGDIVYNFMYEDCAGQQYPWSFTFHVVRTTLPTITTAVPASQTVECAALAVAPALPVVTDVCDNILTPSAPVMGGTYTDCEGTITYTYTYTDCAGLELEWTFTYTIDHTIAPVVPADASANVQCVADAVPPTVPLVTDVCGTPITPVEVITNNLSAQQEGTRTYTYTFTDCSGLSSTWEFVYNIDDNIIPTVTNCPSNVTIQTGAGRTTCDKDYSWTPPTYSDNCSEQGSITVSYAITGATTGTGSGNLSSYIFNKGVSTVTYTYTDLANNINANCSFTVTVLDNTPPVVTCPAPIIVNLPPSECTANVPLTPPTISDNCGVANIVLAQRSDGKAMGEPFGIGSHTVLYVVVDGNVIPNTSTCIQTVLVTGTTTISITCPPTLVLDADAGECSRLIDQLYWLEPANQPVQSGCGAVTYGKIRGDGLSFAEPFPLGNTTVTWRAINGLGEIVSTCDQVVTIVDSEDPTITCVGNQSKETIAGGCTYTVSGTEFDPTAFADNCAGSTISNDFNNSATLAGAIFPKGTTTVTWTVTDASGNTATCSFDVTVTDNEDPTITCVGNQAKDSDAGVCTYTVQGTEFDPTAFADNCTGSTILNNFNNSPTLAGAIFPAGTTTVTWTVTDASGNTATCSFDVTVADNEDPTIACVGNQVRSSNAGGCTYTVSGTEFDPTAFADNCTGATISNDFNNSATLAGASFPKGTTTVTWTVTDAVGHTASCTFDITIEDNEVPTITCVGNQAKDADADVCTYTVQGTEFDPTGFADNCTGATILNDFNNSATLAGAIFPAGTTTVTWTVTDASGNTATCSFDVTVTDNEDPTITCVGNQAKDADAGVCTYTVQGTEFDPTAFADNCTGATILNNFNNSATLAGAIFPKGTTTVTWTVTDASGNTASCSFDVVVTDNEDPTITCVGNQAKDADAGVCTYTVQGTEFDPTAFADNCIGATILNDFNNSATLAGAIFPAGTTTVTWTVTDASGNTATCSFDVTVTDNEDPTIICVGNQAKDADAGACTYTVQGTEFDPTAFGDNCAVSSVINNFNNSATLAGAIFPAGTTTVTWTVTDASGNTATCSFDVVVTDNEDPTITCVGNQAKDADAGVCTYTVQGTEFDPTAFADNCTGATILNNFNNSATLAGAAFPAGTTTVTWTVTDASGNTATCSFDVVVTDNENPTITCVGNQAKDADAGVCTYTVVGTEFDPTAFADNCTGATILNDFNNSASLAGAIFPAGTTTVTWTVTDASGNTATCSFDVVVTDNEDPTITCVGNQAKDADAGVCTYTVQGTEFDPTAFADNCTGATILNNFNNSASLAGAIFPKGTTTVTWTATDASGNTATCSFDVIVTDNEDPTITCVGNQAKDADAGVCTYTVNGTEFDPTAFADNCTGATILNNFNNSATLAGAIFPAGTTTVTWTVTDASDNTATCSFDVVVTDSEDPTITCVGNQAKDADAGVCTYTVQGTEFDPTAFADNCTGATILNDFNNSATLAGASFPKGTTTVTWTVTDASGNTATCSFDVVVTDNEDPTITCVGNQAKDSDAGVCTYTVQGTEFDPTAFADNCTGATILNDFNNSATLAGAIFPKGTTTVTWTVTDASGNSATCSFDVIVTDNEDPTITCVGNQAKDANAGVCTYTVQGTEFDPTAFADNCTGATILNDFNNSATLAGAVFQKGTTTVTWTVTDASGNTATCSFDVVVTDNEDPTITCVGNQAKDADAGVCTYTVVGTEFDPTAFADNCTGATILNNFNNSATLAGATFPAGTTTVTWTVTDASGNTATCSYDVVVTDAELPVVITQDITIQLDATGNASITAAQIDNGSTDNCGIQTISVSPSTFTCANVGPNTVTLTVTDVNGNSNTGTAIVTVQDVTPPVLVGMPADITVNVEANTCQKLITWMAPTATDACGILSVTPNVTTIPLGGGMQLIQLSAGVHTITYTATDVNGNTSSASFTVTVVDNIPPVITGCPVGGITVTASNGNCSAVVSYLQPIPSDNCSGVSMTINNDAYLPGNNFPVGVHTVVYTATDVAGNVTTCTFTITVLDGTPPVITCPANVTVNNDAGQCGANVTFPADAIATDDCGGTPTIVYSPVSGSFFPVGTTTVTATATDEAGNSSSCTFTVTVVDNTAPSLVCPANISQTADADQCGAVVHFGATASDNCALPVDAVTYSHAPGSVFPVGTTTVTATVTDAAGLTASCSFTITITDDQAPVISVLNPAITANNDAGQCYATVIVPMATVEDNCLIGDPVGTRDDGQPLNATYPVGITTITWNITDANGNAATPVIQTVEVTDNQAPVIEPVLPISVNNTPGLCSANVSVPVPNVTDNCTVGTAVGTRSDGLELTDPFPVGMTLITWNISDASGNAATPVTQLVNVADNQAPVINVVDAIITVNNDPGLCSAIVTVPVPTVTENCPGAGAVSGTRSDGLGLGDAYPVGATTITWNVLDASGNPGTATQVIMVNDNEQPVITVAETTINANNTTGFCYAELLIPTPLATDNCPGVGTVTGTRDEGQALTAPYPVGTTVITWTVIDAHNNIGTATQTIVVVDNEKPTFASCPANITQNTDPGVCGANVTFLIIANDNCGIENVTQSHPSGYLFPVGTTTVTATATDDAGNSETCTFTVTVIDNEKPVITAVSPINANTAPDLCTANVSVPTPTVTDNCDVTTLTGTRSDGLALADPYPAGTTTITWTVSDVNGNAADPVEQLVIVTDNQPPVITVVDLTINVNNDPGQCNATVNIPPATATDNCVVGSPVGTRSDALALNAPYPIGNTTITWTVSDANGNAAVPVVQTIHVADNQAPVIDPVSTINANNTPGLCSAVVNVPVPTVTDNCPAGDPTGTRDDGQGLGDPYPVGTTTITWSFTDAAGNPAVSVEQLVIVTDNEVPVIATPSPVSVNNTPGQCAALVDIIVPGVTDNCVIGSPTGTRSDGQPLNAAYPVGTTTIIWNINDASGNPATPVTQTVIVIDNESPVISVLQPAISVNNDPGQCYATVAVPPATADDNCDIAVPPAGVRSDGQPLNASYPIGTTTITWTVSDVNGNPAVAVEQTITVTDIQVPVIAAVLPISVSNTPGLCTAEVTVPVPSVTDNCAIGAPVGTRGDGLALTDPFPVGMTLITWNITDANGNAALPVTQLVNVADTEEPVINVVQTTINVNNTPGFCSADVAVPTPTVTENCPGAGLVTGTRNDGNPLSAAYPVGQTIITWTVLDASGNTGTAIQTINVTDNEAPVITALPAVLSASNTIGFCHAAVPVPIPTALDNCPGVGTVTGTRSDGLLLTDNYPVGTTTITWNVTDAHGNPGTATQTVVVTDDELPTFAVCPANIVRSNDPGACGANVTFLIIANDNCPGITVLQSHPSGHFFPIGTTTVTATATDNVGNSTVCTFTVTVNDTEAPAMPALPELGSECEVIVTPPTTTDNCAGIVTGQTTDPLVYNVQGTYTIDWTFNDGNGNTTIAQQTVVIDDNFAPDITCPADITVNNDAGQCGAIVNFPDAIVSDNCSGTTIEYSHNPGDFFPVGTTIVTVMVTDGADNTAECTFSITVNDTQNPVPTVTSLPTINATCTATVTAPTASDNCDGLIVGETSDPVSFNAPGTYTINWTYTDEAGNSVSQSQTVIVSGSPGIINTHPASITRCEGEQAVFSVSAVGTGYQWELNTGSGWMNLPGQNGTSLTITAVTASMDGDQYRVIVFGACGGVESDPATLTVNASPVVYNVTGGGATCTSGLPVGLSGSQVGVNYQLSRNNINTGASVAGTGNAISFGIQTLAGTYTVIATSTAGCPIAMSGSAVISAGVLPTAFDVTGGGFICGGTGPVIGLDGSEVGVNYQLRRNTILGPVNVGSIVPGTGAAISFGSFTQTGGYTVLATNTATGCTRTMDGLALVIPGGTLPAAFNVTGGGTICGAGGVTIGLSGSEFLGFYQLYHDGIEVGDPEIGLGLPINFGTFTQPGVYTVVASNLIGCSNNMNGSATIITGVQPALFAVTGGGGFCEGSTGPVVGLSGSQTGVTYQLRRNNVNTGSPVAGTGGALSFGNQGTEGTYTVVATHSTGCTATMTGSVTVTENDLPVAFTVTGGGGYCSGPGPVIGLSGSQSGVSYQLLRNGVNSGSPVAGTGAAISFGTRNQLGTYTVLATSGSNCSSTMTGNAIISAGTLPALFDVTGGGSICGGVGPLVGIDGSQTGVNYQLRRQTISGTVNVGSPVPGTGSAISFGNQNVQGLYTVVATNASTGCTRTMNGNALILLSSPLPTAFNVTGGGAICGAGGVPVGLSGSQFLTSYQLLRNGVNTGSPVIGFGGAVSFGTQTQAGVYTVVATSLLGCSNTMNGSVTITTGTQPFLYTVTGGGSTCVGGAGVAVGLSDSDPGVNYQLRINGVNTGSPVAGTGVAITFGNQTLTGTYTVMATNISGCTRVMAGSASITGGVAPQIFTMTGGGAGGSTTSIFQPSANPAVDLANDGTPIELGVKFTSTQNGFINGIRYWKDDDATGTHIGNLWTSTGTLLATATFGGGPVEGWQQVLFSSPVPITAGVTYVASYFSQSGDYAVTDNYFTSAVVNGPLRALANGEQGPTGVYKYTATSSFPTTGYEASNYWVDVVFSSGSGVSYCGGAGPALGLSGSQSGVNYQLMKDGIATGAPVAGTGSPISFGNQSQLGVYTAVATNATTNCTQNMSGNVSIVSGVLPTTFNVTGGGSYCSGPGPLVGLSGSQAGISYQLRRNGVAAGSPVAGTGAAISFGNQSLAGTYTVFATNTSTGCATTMTGSVTVTISGSLPATSIVYSGSPYCKTGFATVTRTGTAGGTYSSTAGLVINPVTGQINLNGSSLGTYTVTYTYGNATCTATATTSVTIVALPTATISYASSAFCTFGTAAVTRVGQAGGTYSANLPGLVINSVSGQINLAASTAGTYVVTYAFSNGACTRTATTVVTVANPPTATISYPGSPYCQTGFVNVTRVGTGGGTYSSTPGLVINAASGNINLGASTPGTYTVTYVFSSRYCSNSTTTSVTILPNVPFTMTCPANLTNVPTNAGLCYATGVNLGTPTVTGCGQITVTNNAPAQFPVGTTNVTWRAQRGAQVITCIQTVRVVDNQNPVATTPANLALCQNGTGLYTIPVPTYSDNCGILSVRYTIIGATTREGNGANASGALNPGQSQITWWITDVNLNTSTPITIVNVNPCITLTKPGGGETNAMKKDLKPSLKMEIAAYPNPSETYFNVKVNSPAKETVEVRMYDNLGKMVEIHRGAPDQVFRFGDGVAAGLYIIEARQSGQKDKATVRVVKQN